ncbi:MAG: hypothetical protein ACRD38_04760 [Nitrososphaerales archaeon]
MQYFQALKVGQVRIRDAATLLKKYTSNALPAIALKESKDSNWEPVGEENLAGVSIGQHGCIISICDKDGNAKAIASWFKKEDADKIMEQMKGDGMNEYIGKIKLPV